MNKGKKIFFDKNYQNIEKTILLHISRECFFTILIDFFFLKILAKKSLKNQFFARISLFWAKIENIFKNKKLNKKLRKHSLSTYILKAFANFWILVKRYFLPLFKTFGVKNQFLAISKIYSFSQKSDHLKRFLVKFPF